MVPGIHSGALWFALFLAVKLVWFHRNHVRNGFSLIVRILGICILGHTVTVFLLLPGSGLIRLAAFFCGGAVIFCLFILYMPFYYNVVNSLSIQTLVLLNDSQDKTLAISDLRYRLASVPIVTGRLDTMAANGYLTRSGEGYSLTPKGRTMARIFAALKDFWKLGPGG